MAVLPITQSFIDLSVNRRERPVKRAGHIQDLMNMPMSG